MVDAIELLTQQHRETEELFARFQRAEDAAQREEIGRTATQQLRRHTVIEEELFYPALREQGGELEAAVLEDLEEHHVVEVMLDEFETTDPTDERYVARFTVLSEMVMHHVEEEEQEQFPLAREQLGEDRLRELGERMLQRYEELVADDDVIDLTKEELYQQARELDIDGRSQMSKRELLDAIKARR